MYKYYNQTNSNKDKEYVVVASHLTNIKCTKCKTQDAINKTKIPREKKKQCV